VVENVANLELSVTSVVITTPTSVNDLDAVRALFREYVSSPGWDAGFQRYLAQQAFEDELRDLPHAYRAPSGALLLARVNGEPAGCVAMKPLEPPSICEMKRLYVRPTFRVQRLGRSLVEAILAEAATAGYDRIRLDTIPSMANAQRLYRALGFREIPAYCENPVPGAVFMERTLSMEVVP
jgi:ribosomal protein S18 acetylase RimI-like enzyme